MRVWVIITLLCIICVLEPLLWLNRCDYDGETINLNNTNCTYSENIGRRLFFHICSKDNYMIYDIRYFWRDEPGHLKPEVVGVQLSQLEFQRVCSQCLK